MKIENVTDIERLVFFEQSSWPEELRAGIPELRRRVKAFPEGIFMLSEGGIDVAQVTVSPKRLPDLGEIVSFAQMRDLEVDRSSDTLWVTNLAVAEGHRGKGYGTQILSNVMEWARRGGYLKVAAGVTASGSAVSTFYSSLIQGASIIQGERIAGYWPEDKKSGGYGILVVVTL